MRGGIAEEGEERRGSELVWSAGSEANRSTGHRASFEESERPRSRASSKWTRQTWVECPERAPDLRRRVLFTQWCVAEGDQVRKGPQSRSSHGRCYRERERGPHVPKDQRRREQSQGRRGSARALAIRLKLAWPSRDQHGSLTRPFWRGSVTLTEPSSNLRIPAGNLSESSPLRRTDAGSLGGGRGCRCAAAAAVVQESAPCASRALPSANAQGAPVRRLDV